MLTFRQQKSLQFASHAQKLPILRSALPPPSLAPNAHWHRSSHAQNDHQTVKSENRPHAGSVDEVLQRLRDGEVDAGRADGEDDDDLAGNLSICQHVL